MVTKAKDAGTKFVNKVIEFVKNLPAKVWKWLNDTITKAATFVSDMAKKGTEAAKGLFDNIVDGVSKLPGEMLEIGKNIVEGIWDGIVSAKDAFVGHVNGFFSGIVDGAKDALGIHSPSRVFRDQVGKQIVAGLVEGMESRASTAVTAVRKISQDMADSIASTDFSISGQLVMDQIRQARDIIAGATSGGIGGGVNGVYQTVAESANYNYNFYQTNNSPKSLSRYEIYRQTKNQLKFAAGR
jgi:phage-related protein